ncbi:MAG: four helix bundle protein [Bacteroidota bacterium]|nr:four helix bundle protein [Bacteroidota bacterium]
MRNDRENIIVDLSFKFALRIIDYAELLMENKKYVIGKQLLRSGTSIGALIKEAQNTEKQS